jgi:hypothetical protein
MLHFGIGYQIVREIQEGHLRDGERIWLVEMISGILPAKTAEARPSRRGIWSWLGSLKLALGGHRS